MVKLKLPLDLAKHVGDVLGWSQQRVKHFFTFEEDKQGFFIAQLQPKMSLSDVEFRTVCALARDFGGDYVRGQRKWTIPGPYAKTEAAETETPTPLPTRMPTETPTPARSEVLNSRLVPVDSVKVPDFLPTRVLIRNDKLRQIRDSIKKHGLKYPVKVRPGPDPDTYELKDGFLRLKSARQLGWTMIPAEIKETSDQEVVIESIVTNKDRLEEDPITVAKKLNILINAFGYTQEKLAADLGVSQPWISDTIRFLKLPGEVQHYLALDNVSRFQGLLLLTVEDPDLQVELAKETKSSGWSTRELADRIRILTGKGEPRTSDRLETAAAAAAEEEPGFDTGGDIDKYEPEEAFETRPFAPPSEAFPEAPEPELTGFDVECPECGVTLHIVHKEYASGKVRHVLEG